MADVGLGRRIASFRASAAARRLRTEEEIGPELVNAWGGLTSAVLHFPRMTAVGYASASPLCALRADGLTPTLRALRGFENGWRFRCSM
jgi:hypothetical protein